MHASAKALARRLVVGKNATRTSLSNATRAAPRHVGTCSGLTRMSVSSVRTFAVSSSRLSPNAPSSTTEQQEMQAEQEAAVNPVESVAERLNAQPQPTESEADVRADQGQAAVASDTPQATMAREEAEAEQVPEAAVNPTESVAEGMQQKGEAGVLEPQPTESEADVRADQAKEDPLVDEQELIKRTVFVGGLSFSVDNEWLKDEILQALDITEGVEIARVARNPMGKSKGFAFVQMSTPELAQALTEQNFEIDGRSTDFRPSASAVTRTRPERSSSSSSRRQSSAATRVPRTEPRNAPSDTVWLGNIPWTVDQTDVQSTMSRFGPVMRVSLPRDRETGRSRGIAYVQYERQEDALEAVREAYNGDGISLDGRPAVVDYAQKASVRRREQQ